MYEHLRNDLSLALSARFDPVSLDMILNTLDKISADYTITERETSLAVIDEEIPKLVKIFLSSKKLEGCSDKTIGFYANRLKIFFDTVRHHPQDIVTNEIRLFLAEYQVRAGLSDRTLDKFRQVLNGFFEWCLNEEYISKNPCKNIKEIKYEVVPRCSLTRFQLERVRRSCKTKRDLAVVDVLYSTGVRVSELVNMKLSDMDGDAIKIIGKGKKHNIVYLNDAAKISLDEYLKERKGDNDYIFVSDRNPYGKLSTRSIERLITNVSQGMNIKLTPHILRHTSATLALQSGMPITQVQKMLGHSSVNTTQIYAETSQEEVKTSHRKYVI